MQSTEDMVHIHPEHDAVASEVATWYVGSTPEIGREVSEFWFGYHCNLSSDTARVILRIDEPDQVSAALRDARNLSGIRTVAIWVDDRHRAAKLNTGLQKYGCRLGDATTHLALVGSIKPAVAPENLIVEKVDGVFTDWARIKLQAFDDSELPPLRDRLAREIAVRASERAIAEYQIGLLDGEKVAILAYYPGIDQMVFNLATRVPYRHRGIAQTMLARWANSGIARGSRSLMINATDGGRPAQLYRRMGFVDEIYWYQSYELSADNSS